jgi:hypothetical protein
MKYRIQILSRCGFYYNTNHESDDLDNLKRFASSDTFRDSRVRVVDDSHRVHYEPSAGITAFHTISSSASATVEKDHDGIRSTATIDLLVVSGMEFRICIPECLTRDLDPLPECAAFYPTADRLYRACLAGAWEGISDASKGFRDSCGCVTYTRLSGTRLPLRFTTGFEIAASLALLRALERPERLPAHLSRNMGGWRVVA